MRIIEVLTYHVLFYGKNAFEISKEKDDLNEYFANSILCMNEKV